MVVDGIGRWRHVVLADCLAHNASGHVHTIDEFMTRIREGVKNAISAADDAGASALAVTMIGTSTRVTPSCSAQAIASALHASMRREIGVVWSVSDPSHAAAVREAFARFELGGEDDDG